MTYEYYCNRCYTHNPKSGTLYCRICNDLMIKEVSRDEDILRE